MSATSTASNIAPNKTQLTEDCRVVNLRVFEEISAIFRFPVNRLNGLHLSAGRNLLLRNFVEFAAEEVRKLLPNVGIAGALFPERYRFIVL